METYSLMRQFADSWGLLALFLVFIAVVIWAFRPGARETYRYASESIFRNETKPAPDPDAPQHASKEAR